MAHRLRTPFRRTTSQSAASDFDDRVRQGGTFGFDAVGYALDVLPTTGLVKDVVVQSLREILAESGAAWEPTNLGTADDPRWTLTRRDLAAAKAAIADAVPVADRAGQFLLIAWENIATRNPSPSIAYDNAIKAVEAAAHPIVSPKNDRATLGTILKDLENKPSKWAFALGDIGTIIAMGQTLWSQHFRHGTQVREDHTLQEADAAVHLAIPLVRYFGGGLVALSDPDAA